jgi:hypothetical protein
MAEKKLDPLQTLTLRWSDDATSVRPSEVPDTLYHYTDAAGLYGLLSSASLWLTDHRFLNDTTEFTHTTQIMKNVISEIKSDTISDAAKRTLTAISDGKEFANLREGFVFSFTEEKDDLGQWRAYANDGQGFTVGFSGKLLAARFGHDQSEYDLAKVSYDANAEKRALTIALDELLEEVNRLVTANRTAEQDVVRRAAFAFGAIARGRGSVNKHPSFNLEKEWRIVSYPGDEDEPKVRLSNGKLVRYLEIPSKNQINRLPITSIGIGPRFSGPEIVDAVRSLARQLHHSVEIYFANTPYRRVK